MATAYVAVEYLIGEDGQRKNYGDRLDIANTTDAEKANFARLVDYGIITTAKPTQSPSGGSAEAQ